MGLSQKELLILQELISFNTINPPGNEDECASFIADILEDCGYHVMRLEFAPRRTSLLASLKSDKQGRPGVCFCGHMDTVPLGDTQWQWDPFGAQIVGDKIYGRGASDMKSGLAAMIMAGTRITQLDPQPNVVLVFTAGEETFCEGARYIANNFEVLGDVGALIVCEPTSNRPMLGHKGAIHLRVKTRGISAHASMPELGDNAIYKAADIALRLRDFKFGMEKHHLLGKPTINVGTISGGININSVPDSAQLGIDIRTIPGLEPQKVLRLLQETAGEDTEVTIINHAFPVATDPDHPWIKVVFNIVEQVTGISPSIEAVPYFTDASALTPALGNPPTVILGPGEPEMAHKTDEYCHISKVEHAADIYTKIAEKWATGQGYD
ncbi:MAG: M20 family peptidase [Deltaproteobacteria bacterium]|nr:MAG: M20 family peptidase [Deltaproteobacteria bacterium]